MLVHSTCSEPFNKNGVAAILVHTVWRTSLQNHSILAQTTTQHNIQLVVKAVQCCIKPWYKSIWSVIQNSLIYCLKQFDVWCETISSAVQNHLICGAKPFSLLSKTIPFSISKFMSNLGLFKETMCRNHHTNSHTYSLNNKVVFFVKFIVVS